MTLISSRCRVWLSSQPPDPDSDTDRDQDHDPARVRDRDRDRDRHRGPNLDRDHDTSPDCVLGGANCVCDHHDIVSAPDRDSDPARDHNGDHDPT